MKLLPLLLLICLDCGAQNCKSVKTDYGEWHIVYNKYYKKYAAVIIDSALIGTGNERMFLLKDHSGDYGIYGEGWDELNCYSCGDKSKSLFTDPCAVKRFILEYIRKLKDNSWQ